MNLYRREYLKSQSQNKHHFNITTRLMVWYLQKHNFTLHQNKQKTGRKFLYCAIANPLWLCLG
jgi:GT2 family glycosyltransferase